MNFFATVIASYALAILLGGFIGILLAL